MHCIDYQIIVDAQRYYSEVGFTEIPVPWIVGKEAYYATKPDGARDIVVPGGYMNASGEQSFLELLLTGHTLTKHLCVTTCMRDDVEDELHQKYFVKLELIDMDATSESLDRMIQSAVLFYERYVGVEVVCTGIGTYDIVDRMNGLELGSYGVREYGPHKWVYGTGVALPRLSIIQSYS